MFILIFIIGFIALWIVFQIGGVVVRLLFLPAACLFLPVFLFDLEFDHLPPTWFKYIGIALYFAIVLGPMVLRFFVVNTALAASRNTSTLPRAQSVPTVTKPYANRVEGPWG